MITLKELESEIPYIVLKDCGLLQKGFHVTNFDGILTCRELPGWCLRYYKDPSKFDKIYQRAKFVLDKETLKFYIEHHKNLIKFYERLL
jgi:hypothetical protein